MAAKFATIDEYIMSFPENVQPVLQRIREVIVGLLPGCTETISYDMPTMVLGRFRIYFAGWKNHVAFYAVPRFDEELERKVVPFRAAKDTVQFSYKYPIPYDLIEEMVKELIARETAAR